MQEKYYLKVYDIPILNWELVTGGDYTYMRTKRSDEEVTNEDVKAFHTLYNNYLKVYGLSDAQAKFIKLQKQFVEMSIKYIETDNLFFYDQLAILKQELEKSNPTNIKGMTIADTCVVLSKWLGRRIDKKQETLADLKDLIKGYERANEKE